MAGVLYAIVYDSENVTYHIELPMLFNRARIGIRVPSSIIGWINTIDKAIQFE